MRGEVSFLEGLATIALVSVVALAGCGPAEESPCADKTCEFGTCDSNDGTCVNESSCDVAAECIPGYECGTEGTCVPLNSCSADADCDAGVCENGVCVNPESCSENGDCLPRTYCDTTGEDGGTCQPDPCNGVRCPRGVCERGTGKCVSKDECSKETEKFDCVSGQACADGTCVSNDAYCDHVDCERGKCSLQARSCVNPDECGEDGECLSGYFCNEMNLCRPNLCEQQNIDCGDQGDCRPATGECENPTSCGSSEDCLRGHVCIGGTCRLESSACGNAGGEGGCPGNQKCQYDEKKGEASCAEPTICETSLDCKNDRRCGGRSCLKPESCEADRFEENDSKSAATIFTDGAPSGRLRASLCPGDSDLYRVDTTKLAGSSSTGKLVVEVDVPDRDRGLGEVELEVLDSSGSTHGTASTGGLGVDGHARVTKTIMSSGHGTYMLKVSPGSDMKKPGVDYRLSADILPASAINACGSATTIRPNQRVSGTTEMRPSTALGSSCTQARNPAAEKIFALRVQRPQELNFVLTPQAKDANLTMSLRRRCTQRGSEIACSAGAKKGKKETMTALVGPGTYHLIVQPPAGEKGGRFRLMINRTYTTCAPTGNYCDAKDNAHECTSDGGRFQKLQCDNGCNRARGRCIPPDGDVCGTAPTISPQNAQTRTASIGQANNEYDVGAGSCLGSAPTKTAGSELTYELKVPSRQSVRLEATFANNVDGSMYLVRDCSQVENTCQRGVKSSTEDADREVLRYTNGSHSSDETLYLVVDTAGGQQVSTAELAIKYRNIQCVPGDTQCSSSGGVEVCGQYGVNSTTIGTCNLSCSMGTCQSKLKLSGSLMDTCSKTVDVAPLARQSGGVKLTGDWSQFNDDISHSPCAYSGPGSTIGSYDIAHNETIYQLDLKAGETVDATMSTSGDPSVWIKPVGDCGKSRTKCLAGDESEYGSASTSYTASSRESVVVLVDRESGYGGSSFTVDLEVK